jgi:hypothetical protein
MSSRAPTAELALMPRKWPPDFEIDFGEVPDEVAQRGRRRWEDVSDEQLLTQVVRACDEIVEIANPAFVLEQFGDEAWEIEEIIPINPDLQACPIWHLAAETLALATAALAQRASVTVLGQIRIVCDAYCLLKWLKEPERDPAREARTLGLLLAELDDERKVIQSLPRTPEQAEPRRGQLDALSDFQSRLASVAGRPTAPPPVGSARTGSAGRRRGATTRCSSSSVTSRPCTRGPSSSGASRCSC